MKLRTDGGLELYGNLNNTSIGQSALSAVTTGAANTGIGTYALNSNTTGAGNIAIGSSALFNNQTGNNNTATGVSSLITNVSGNNNTATGQFALRYNTTGSSNTAIGVGAFVANFTGSNNSALGANTSVGADNLENATAIGALAQVDASNSMVLGSINGVNSATADTKVGIGTTAPVSKLNVVGDVGLSDGSNVFSNGVVTILLVNQTGATSVAGDIVIAYAASDNSFATTAAQGNTAVIGVVYESGIANGAVCRIAVSGVVDVKANGTILRGQHCITSTITGAADAIGSPGSGSSIGVWLTAPPSGSLGKVLLK